jgi:putative NADH-flavin reductase
MKIALIGASGFVGSAILEEAASRGHSITAIARDAGKVEKLEGVTPKAVDATDVAGLKSAISGHDAVISAFNGGWGDPDIYRKHLDGSRAIVNAAKAAKTRLIVVGGAGSLHAPDGSQFVDSPEFPTEWKQGALAARDALAELRNEAELDWSFLSPAFILKPGERTGKYRTGGEQPVVDAEGQSTISAADLAVALVDEAERPRHTRKRFTVAY